MSRSVSNVAISTDTFAGWLVKTNVLLDALTNEIVTVNSTTAGANTTGNASVIGILAANIISTPAIRGGAAGNTANIQGIQLGFANSTVSSNVTVAGYLTTISSNSLYLCKFKHWGNRWR